MPKKEHEIQPRLMRMKQVAQYCSLSHSYIYHLIAKSEFPRGTKIHPRLTVWERSDIDAFLDELKKEAAA